MRSELAAHANTVVLICPERRSAIFSVRAEDRIPRVQLRRRDAVIGSKVVAANPSSRFRILVTTRHDARLRRPGRRDPHGRASGAACFRSGSSGGRRRAGGLGADADAIILVGPQRRAAACAVSSKHAVPGVELGRRDGVARGKGLAPVAADGAGVLVAVARDTRLRRARGGHRRRARRRPRADAVVLAGPERRGAVGPVEAEDGVPGVELGGEDVVRRGEVIAALAVGRRGIVVALQIEHVRVWIS